MRRSSARSLPQASLRPGGAGAHNNISCRLPNDRSIEQRKKQIESPRAFSGVDSRPASHHCPILDLFQAPSGIIHREIAAGKR